MEVNLCTPSVRPPGEIVLFPRSGDNSLPREGYVERINQYPLYQLGKSLRAVTTQSGDVAAHLVFFDLHVALMAMHALLGGAPFPLGISRAPAAHLRSTMEGIWDRHFISVDDKGE